MKDNKKKKENISKKDQKENMVELGISEVGEDATKYGEFISSYFAWISLPEQKENARRLEKITEEKDRVSKRK